MKKGTKIWIFYLFSIRFSFITAHVYEFKILIYENALFIHLSTSHKHLAQKWGVLGLHKQVGHVTVEWTELHHTAKGNSPDFFSSCFLYVLYIMCVHEHKQNRRDSRIPGAKWITLVFIKTFNNWGFVAIKLLLALTNRHDIYLPLWRSQCLMT